ncbi:DNA polymerase III subunit gamma/tau [Patescibacteria group bacterium]|nr:DNA polymerase III subunit gamma/tau [Patescibacteria group bacterium]
MSITLYRKYRPKCFKEIVGQNHIKITLQNEIQTNSIAHAYLFCGPRAVGKTTFARIFANAINCPKRKTGEYEPCGQCDICKEIIQTKSLDIIEIDAASHTGVDNVRENIVGLARIASSKYKYKVFIIDEVHMLSISAFNALLKTIEEPPANVIFILCTTEVHKVPTTIISRCQRFDFRRICVNDVIKKLNYIVQKENIKIEQSILESIARQCEGYMRDAESLLGQIISIGGKKITQEEADLVIPRSDINEIINLIKAITKKDCGTAVRLINNLVDEGIDIKIFTTDLIETLRKIMLNKINPAYSGLDLGETLEIKINQITKDLELEQLVGFIEKFNSARNKIKDSFIIQLPIELAITELCIINSRKPNKLLDIKQAKTAGTAETAPPQFALSDKANWGGAVSAPATPAAPVSQVAINKKQITDKWEEMLSQIKKYNHSLPLILKNSVVEDVKGDQIFLTFKYKFHKDNIDKPQTKKLAEKALLEIYKTPLFIKTKVDKSIKINGNLSNNNNAPDNDITNNLLKTFGGKII